MIEYRAIGCTATQVGLKPAQRATAAELLALARDEHGAREFHHGDCIGGDAELAALAASLGYRLVSHPPRNRGRRAFVVSAQTFPPAPYLVRNHRIVDRSAAMLACPSSDVEELRSGTWATVRYARKVGRPLLVVGPDGSVIERRGFAA